MVDKDLRRLIARRFDSLDVDEVVGATYLKLTTALRNNRGRPIDWPMAFVRTSAKNAALDQLKARESLQEKLMGLEPPDTLEDAFARMLDKHATAERVHEAMRASIEAGDHMAVGAVTAFLDAANETGKPLSFRLVAELLGVTHPTVSKAFERFAKRMPSE